MFEFQLVITEQCNLNCKYCVPKNTQILDKKFDNINIENIKIGDEILGFDEYGKKGIQRKIYPTKVLNISKRTSDVIKIVLNNGQSIEITPEHPILNPRGHSKHCWKPAKNYKLFQSVYTFPYKNKNSKCFWNSAEIQEIKHIGKKEVYNLETDSHTFFANNFAVHNCYMKNKQSMMNGKRFDDIFRRLPIILERFGETDYNACFFGGEPLLNYDLIKYVLPILKKDEKCKSIVLPTNGLLLNKERVDFLKGYDVNISWSFDGLWAPMECFPESIEKIRKLLDPLYSCKVMISPERTRSIVDNYKWFVEDFNVPNPDFSIVRDDIWTPFDVEKFELEIIAYANQVIKYFKERQNIGFPAPFSLYALDTILGKNKGKRPFGCFAGWHGAAFMPDGGIYPCARFGTSQECDMLTVHTQEKKYFNPEFFEKEHQKVISHCKGCELYQYCNAGCTWSQLHNNSKPIENICKLLKIMYKETFRIVDELKDNEKFKSVFRNMIKEII